MKRENIRGMRCSNQTQFPARPNQQHASICNKKKTAASALQETASGAKFPPQPWAPNPRVCAGGPTPSQLHVCFLKQPHRAMRVFRRAPCTAMLMTGTGPAPLTWRPAPVTMTRARPRSWAVAHASKSSRLASMNGEELAPHRGRKSTG